MSVPPSASSAGRLAPRDSSRQRRRSAVQRVLGVLGQLDACAKLDQVLPELLQLLAEQAPVETLILLVEDPGGGLRLAGATDDRFGSAPWRRGRRFARVLDGEVEVVRDLLRTVEWRTLPQGARELAASAICLPLRLGSRRGLALCCSAAPAAFDDDHRDRLQRYLPLLSRAVQHFESLGDLQRLADSQRRADFSARAHRDLLRGIAAHSTHATILADGDGRIDYWNAISEQLFGYSRGEAEGLLMHELIATPESLPGYRAALEQARRQDHATAPRAPLRTLACNRDGLVFPVDLVVTATHLDGRWLVAGIVTDVSHQLAAREALRRQEVMLRQFLENADNALVALNTDYQVIYFNRKYTELFRLDMDFMQSSPGIEAVIRQVCDNGIYPRDEADELVRQRIEDLETSDPERKIMPPRRDGKVVEGYSVRLPNVGFLLVFRDITEFKRQESKLLHLASHDPLTGLPNRSLLHDRIDRASRQVQRNGGRFAVLLVDLDQFKLINDNLGHAVGDKVLREVSRRLSDCVRATDSVARLGGDEFVVVLADIGSVENAARVAETVREAVARPMLFEHRRFDLTASIGIAACPEQGRDVETLLRHADAAMYQVKALGRNGYRMYSSELSQELSEKLSLRSGLRQALDNQEFELHYQPQIDLRSGRLIGVEALLRWHHPEAGLVMPGRFIPVAEESGLIEPIGRWVMNAACRQIRRWQALRLPRFPVSVNVSARQFAQADFEEMVASALIDNGIEPCWLDIELTESLIMADPERAVVSLGRLKSMGIRITGDDFGTGYSSLAYLKRFPLDRIKVDRAFVRDITTDPDDAVIIRTIVEMGHNLGIDVLAEGVETAEQVRYLNDLGCDEIQGFYIARALPADQLTEFAGGEGAPATCRAAATNVAVCGEDATCLDRLESALRRDGHQVQRAATPAEALGRCGGSDLRALIRLAGPEEDLGGLFGKPIAGGPDYARIAVLRRPDPAGLMELFNQGGVDRVLDVESADLESGLLQALREIDRERHTRRIDRSMLRALREAKSRPVSSWLRRGHAGAAPASERQKSLLRLYDRVRASLYDSGMNEIVREALDELARRPDLLSPNEARSAVDRLYDLRRMQETGEPDLVHSMLALLRDGLRGGN